MMSFEMPQMPQMPELPTWSANNDIDAKLQALVAVAENSEENAFAFPITLMTKGGVVSGMLVPHARWAAETVALASTADSDGFADSVRHITTPFAFGGEFDLEDDEFDRIHLVDAVIWVGVFPSPPPTMQWRGRISDVSGWSLGAMNLS